MSSLTSGLGQVAFGLYRALVSHGSIVVCVVAIQPSSTVHKLDDKVHWPQFHVRTYVPHIQLLMIASLIISARSHNVFRSPCVYVCPHLCVSVCSVDFRIMVRWI